jgi:hypothetical protein
MWCVGDLAYSTNAEEILQDCHYRLKRWNALSDVDRAQHRLAHSAEYQQQLADLETIQELSVCE